jgi:hypothetical protein
VYHGLCWGQAYKIREWLLDPLDHSTIDLAAEF